jgi:NAD(P)-dependent dehydrogenase (short-subunit alcohol dehydrogenase family)
MNEQEIDLNDMTTTTKVAFITGGASGIGLGVARQLASEGYAIALMGRSVEERVKENVDRVKIFDTPVIYIRGDVASDENRKSALQKIDSQFGRLDVLVNNAGVAPKVRRDILETTEESFDHVLNINLRGTFFLTQQVAQYMIGEVKNNIGIIPTIINVSSISVYASSTTRGEYCISKAGIGMITALFADRLAEYGINVYEIRPGIIATDMTEDVKEKYDRLILEEGILPIKRWGSPEDIGNAVSVLCSGKLAYSTGEVINVDGGFHVRRL